MPEVQQLTTRIAITGIPAFTSSLKQAEEAAKRTSTTISKTGQDGRTALEGMGAAATTTGAAMQRTANRGGAAMQNLAKAAQDGTRAAAGAADKAKKSFLDMGDAAALAAGAAGGWMLSKVSIPALQAAISLDTMTRGLTSVMGSSKAASAELENLRQVTFEFPGLSFDTAVQGSLALQSMGMSADKARRLMTGLSNMAVLSGRGVNEVQGALIQLQQTLGSGKLQGDELRIIAEAIPSFRAMLVREFGTATGEEIMGQFGEKGMPIIIERIMTAMDKMPRATLGIGASIGRLEAKWQMMLQTVGTKLIPALSKAVSFLQDMLQAMQAVLGSGGMITVIIVGPFVALGAALWTAVQRGRELMVTINGIAAATAQLASTQATQAGTALTAGAANVAATAENTLATGAAGSMLIGRAVPGQSAYTSTVGTAGAAFRAGGATIPAVAEAAAPVAATGFLARIGAKGGTRGAIAAALMRGGKSFGAAGTALKAQTSGAAGAGLASLGVYGVAAYTVYSAFKNLWDSEVAPSIAQAQELEPVGNDAEKASMKLFRTNRRDRNAGKALLRSMTPGGVTPADVTRPPQDPPALQRIDTNTRRIAENTRDYRRYALGGGELGRIGVTPVEMAGIAGRRDVRVSVDVSGVKTFEQVIAMAVQQSVSQMKRQGAL